MGTSGGHWVAEVASVSHGKLLAFLAARCHDLAAVEDALAEAYRAGLSQWPVGAPDEPERWLLTTAKRRLVDAMRRESTRRNKSDAVRELIELGADEGDRGEPLGDERLALMFVCAHPAIDPGVRTALMLQAVLGLDAATIASAFLVSPATMSQRLVRAKTKIRDAGIPFEVPERAGWGERLDAVLEAIYAAFGTGWDEPGADERRAGLAGEAIDLGRLVTRLVPDEPEAFGLLALMLFSDSRRKARRVEGEYVSLEDQEIARWDSGAIHEAFAALEVGSRLGRLGRFQLEALIQAAHARRLFGEAVQWELVADLYGALVATWPTIGAHIGHAAAKARVAGPEAGLVILDSLPPERVAGHQPYWATRAALLALAGSAEADAAFTRALGLTEDPAIRRFLLQRQRGGVA